MSRPLLISDCDEVLLHFTRHFADWLDTEHNMDFRPESENFGDALFDRGTGGQVPTEQVWPLLDLFFDTEMHRQTLVPDVLESLGRIGELADILILTNLGDRYHPHRVAQLDSHGIRHEVMCNQGPKGPALKRILAARQPRVALFVDDLPMHHESARRHVPDLWRLHMVAEPGIAPLIPPAPAAHKRIDTWAEATDWVLARLAGQ